MNRYIIIVLAFASIGLIARGESLRSFYAQLPYAQCVGQPYGTPGCPVKSAQVVPPNCGDAIVDADEECDEGRFNGVSYCSSSCSVYFCGDGVVSQHIGESCDPATEVYAAGSKVLTEMRIAAEPACGTFCVSPCIDAGCTQLKANRCKYDYSKPACPAGSSASAQAVYKGAAQSSLTGAGNPQLSLSFPFPNQSATTSQESSVLQMPQAAGECGDGVLNIGEQCDDGNANNFDSCTNQCTAPYCGDGIVEGFEQCDARGASTGTCDADCTYPVCGDGFRNKSVGEECDDGNEKNTDSCTNDCELQRCGDGFRQPGEQCDDGNGSEFDACRTDCSIPVCGDGRMDKGEECDDGNFNNTDSCTNQCKAARCGNGVRDGTDACDDGNTNNFDACTNDCRVPVCGDGIVTLQTPYREECDDGNTVDSDSCSNTCKAVLCGDGIIQFNEQCDDGNREDFDACSNTCVIARCGDGIRQDAEECDDGNGSNLDYCLTSCLFSVCGNGVIEGTEECDDANERDGDGCSNRCGIETMCGNSIVEGIEECDAGDLNSSETPNACRRNCRIAFCGDGVIDEAEECDSSDGCTAECNYPTFMAAHGNTVWGGTVAFLLLGGSGAGLIFRKRLLDLSRKAAEAVKSFSVDDIPLDELEMPWHKWEDKK